MAFRSNSATRKVVDYMANGGTLTEAQANARFGVRNLSALIARIKPVVEAYGNHLIFVEPTKTSTSAYGMVSFNK